MTAHTGTEDQLFDASHFPQEAPGFWGKHSRARRPLEAWCQIARHADWKTFDNVKAVFPHADQYKRFVIFDVGGNKYRLIAVIHYNRRKVFVRHVMTHADYTRGDWKNE